MDYFFSGFITGCMIFGPIAALGVVAFLWYKVSKSQSIIMSKQKIGMEQRYGKQ